jgi:hypothetical protein
MRGLLKKYAPESELSTTSAMPVQRPGEDIPLRGTDKQLAFFSNRDGQPKTIEELL